MAGSDEHEIAIIGSGFAGIGAAIRLRGAGFDDFVVLERAGDLGGTWRDNTYPGCACDVQSHLYSFSFAPNPGWSHTHSPAAEILRYLREVADRFGIPPRIRFGHEVTGARWDAAARRWRIETARGTVSARVLVMAGGALSDPHLPSIAGLDRFEGPAFHASRWRHDVELAGARVAVVGTGASAVQIVPAIQPRVEHLVIFQRTPPWILPRRGGPIGERARSLFRRFPFTQRLVRLAIYLEHEAFVPGLRSPRLARIVERLARFQLRRSIPDPALRAKMTPRYTLGCKRVLLSNDYLPAVSRRNVDVVTEPIVEVRARSLVTADGAEHPADVLVLATGFRPTDPPLAPVVHGRDGRSLADAWGGSPRAHLGTTVAGFPNLFVLMGPNSGLGHSSVVYMMEAQIDHMVGALSRLRETGSLVLEPRADAQEAFVASVDRRMRGTVWTAGGCKSWYLDATGRNSTLWPDHTWRFRRRVARFDPREYHLDDGPVAPPDAIDAPHRTPHPAPP